MTTAMNRTTTTQSAAHIFTTSAPVSDAPLIRTDSEPVDENKAAEKQPEAHKSIGELLVSRKRQIEAALPKHLTADRMLRIVMTEITKNPKLKECTAASLIGSVMQCSQLGLEPGGALGHAYLIPYKNNQKGTTECQFMIGYRGMIDLARRSGQVLALGVRPVYSNDKFEYCYGLSEKCIHVPSSNDRGDFIAAYAVIKLRDDSYYFEVMTKSDIDKIRDKSADYNRWLKYGKKGVPPIWVEHYDEMAKKTVVRHVFKYLPISIEIQSAVGFDEQAERGEQNNSWIIDGELDAQKLSAPQSKSAELANKLIS